jgi:N,N'-diacetyllegionaminate synthase
MIKIIAELAQGFEGNSAQAHLLLHAAAKAGADAAKFQLIYADELCTPDHKHYEQSRSLEMVDNVWKALAVSARQLKVELYLDVFGVRSLALASDIGAHAVKIHGTDMCNISLLKAVAQSSVGQVLLGAGGGFMPEIAHAVELLADKQVVVLLGYQGYPTPVESNQIDRVRVLASFFSKYPNVKIGFADHASPGDSLSIALAATALGAGAQVFEKHLTLAQVMQLEDYEAALNPDQFFEFSTTLRDCAEALGSTKDALDFGMTDSEYHYRQWTRKHVVASTPIKAGTIITPEHVVLKRTPLENMLTELAAVYDAYALRDIEKNQPIAAVDIGKSRG